MFNVAALRTLAVMKKFRGRDRPRKKNSSGNKHRQTKTKTEHDQNATKKVLMRQKNKSKKVLSATPRPPVNQILHKTSAQRAWLLPSSARSSRQPAAIVRTTTSSPSPPRLIVLKNDNITAPAQIGSPGRATKNVGRHMKNLQRAWTKILPTHQKNE